MNDKIFIDSNVIIYCYSATDSVKQSIARNLVLEPHSIISTQVINETLNVLRKKFNIQWPEFYQTINDFQNNFSVYTVSVSEIKLACTIAEKYKISYYDSLIIAAALSSGCTILYSEGMHNNT